jgi:hypothetical protein
MFAYLMQLFFWKKCLPKSKRKKDYFFFAFIVLFSFYPIPFFLRKRKEVFGS